VFYSSINHPILYTGLSLWALEPATVYLGAQGPFLKGLVRYALMSRGRRRSRLTGGRYTSTVLSKQDVNCRQKINKFILISRSLFALLSRVRFVSHS
jgi:hypothetical protein